MTFQNKVYRANFRNRQKEPKKPVPIATDAERIVCATFLAHNMLFERYATRLKASDFHVPLHREIIEAGTKLVVENKPANSVTVESKITEFSPIPDLSVGEYLRELNRFIKGKDDIEAYVSEVVLASKRRGVLALAEQYSAKAHTADHDIINQLSADVMKLAGDGDNPGMVHLAPTFDAVFQDIMRRDAEGFGPSGYLSGFHEIDDAIGGFKKAKLYYLVANEKVGKSALALTIARQFLLQDIPVGIFSLEMKSDEVGERLLVMESGINVLGRYKGQRLTDEESIKLSEAADRCATWSIYCNDLATLTPSAIIMNGRHSVKVQGAKALIVDYVQIVNGEDGEKEDTRKRVEKASRAMARMAKELCVPVIALAQLNRKTVERAASSDWRSFKPDAARPRRGDIRETAQLEMDADAVIAIYRPEIFFKELRPFAGHDQKEEIEFEEQLKSYRGVAELNILVNRSGPDGIRCKCSYKPELGLFVPYPRRMFRS